LRYTGKESGKGDDEQDDEENPAPSFLYLGNHTIIG